LPPTARQLTDGVVQHPADDVRVVRGGGNDDHEKEPPGEPAAREPGPGERPDRAASRVTPERPFRHQPGHADDEHDEQVKQHERRASIASDHVRETPHVTEAERNAHHRDDRAGPRRERFAKDA
jgi:hypothetical protein